MSWRALSAAERSEKVTKPKPLGLRVVRSTEIVESETTPYLAKWSLRTCSVVSREMPPTNSFALSESILKFIVTVHNP